MPIINEVEKEGGIKQEGAPPCIAWQLPKTP